MWCMRSLVSLFASLVSDLVQFLRSVLRSRASLAAENLFLRKQLAFYQERKVRPRPLTDPVRLSLVRWSRFFDWKPALRIVKPNTVSAGAIIGHITPLPRRDVAYYCSALDSSSTPAESGAAKSLILRVQEVLTRDNRQIKVQGSGEVIAGSDSESIPTKGMKSVTPLLDEYNSLFPEAKERTIADCRDKVEIPTKL